MATVVSCYYVIPSKYSHQVYGSWIDNFMKIGFKCVVYCDQKSFDVLSNLYEETDSLKYRIVEINDFVCSKLNWNDESGLDPERSIHSEQLYKVWNEKIFFVKRAIEENIFNTEYFIWTDIGSFRESDRVTELRGAFPSVHKLPKDKLSFRQICNFQESHLIDVHKVDNRFTTPYSIIGAGIWGGSKEMLLTFSGLYYDMLEEFDKNKVFKGKEQNILAFLVIRYPHMFNLILSHNLVRSSNDNKLYTYVPSNVDILYDFWFYMHYYLSTCKMDISNMRTVFICPDHNEKYRQRKITTEDRLQKIGIKSIAHHKSGTENYPACLIEATINVLEQNLNTPFLLVEDDVAWTGIREIDIPLDADAIYLGISFCAGHETENTHKFYADVRPYSDTQCKVNNMLSTHAIFYISERYKRAVLKEMYKIRGTNYCSDVAISRLQPHFNIYANSIPLFYQDDPAQMHVTKIKFDFGDNHIKIMPI